MHLLKAYLYICIKILKELKNFTREIVPKAVDEYLELIEKAKTEMK